MSKVMIVEDDQILREAYKVLFMKNGFEIRLASNGKEALTIEREFEPDAIVLDYRMPVMDGLEFCQQTAFDKKKILLFTNYPQETLKKFMELGIQHIYPKVSTSPHDIIKEVREVIS